LILDRDLTFDPQFLLVLQDQPPQMDLRVMPFNRERALA